MIKPLITYSYLLKIYRFLNNYIIVQLRSRVHELMSCTWVTCNYMFLIFCDGGHSRQIYRDYQYIFCSERYATTSKLLSFWREASRASNRLPTIERDRDRIIGPRPSTPIINRARDAHAAGGRPWHGGRGDEVVTSSARMPTIRDLNTR